MVVRTICTAAISAAGVDGIVKRNSTEALRRESTLPFVTTGDPLT
jgi:hypothetical protein